MKGALFSVLLLTVLVSVYNGPVDANANQLPSAQVDKLSKPIDLRLDRNVDILAWDSSADSGGTLTKGTGVTVIGFVGQNAIVTIKPVSHKAYLVPVSQLPAAVSGSRSAGKPCPLDPQKRICEVKH